MELVKKIKPVENIDVLGINGPIEQKWNENLEKLNTKEVKALLSVLFRTIYTHYVETHRTLKLYVLGRLINREYRKVAPPLTLKELMIGASASRTLPIKLAMHPTTSANHVYIPAILGFNLMKAGEMDIEFDPDSFMLGEVEGLSLEPNITKQLESFFNE